MEKEQRHGPANLDNRLSKKYKIIYHVIKVMLKCMVFNIVRIFVTRWIVFLWRILGQICVGSIDA